jgi:hypothetical protein
MLSHNYENDPSGSDLAVFVKLIDERGPDAVIEIVDRLVDRPDLVLPGRRSRACAGHDTRGQAGGA